MIQHLQVLREQVARGRARGGQLLAQAQDAFQHLSAGMGRLAVQAVQACPGVGVYHGQGHGLGRQVLQDPDQGGVLEHIGVVARVVGVSVTEHDPIMIGHGGGPPCDGAGKVAQNPQKALQ